MSRVRELQKGVAKQCMLQMNISLTAINDFDNKDIVYSENMDGKISRIRKEERDFIKNLKKKTVLLCIMY